MLRSGSLIAKRRYTLVLFKKGRVTVTKRQEMSSLKPRTVMIVAAFCKSFIFQFFSKQTKNRFERCVKFYIQILQAAMNCFLHVQSNQVLKFSFLLCVTEV